MTSLPKDTCNMSDITSCVQYDFYYMSLLYDFGGKYIINYCMDLGSNIQLTWILNVNILPFQD